MPDDLNAATECDPAAVTLDVGRGILRRTASAHRTGDDYHMDSVLAGIPDRDLKAAAGACGIRPNQIPATRTARTTHQRWDDSVARSPPASIPDETLIACVEAFHDACRAAHVLDGDEADVDDEIREGIAAALAAYVDGTGLAA